MYANVLKFVVPVDPAPKQRPRAFLTKNNRIGTYTDPKTRKAEDVVRIYCRNAMRKLGLQTFTGPVAVTAIFFRSTRRAVDLDNLFKLVTDAINEVAYTDDCQIVEVRAVKSVDEGQGRTIVVIRQVPT